MRTGKITIEFNQSGFIIRDEHDPLGFVVFAGNERERFVKHIAEAVADTSLDEVIKYRQQEIDATKKRLGILPWEVK